ncbi:isoleucine N-monooxygenase 2-like [Arachis ipaensis]|uniref:isoleucine N-monooxygenase 2-like n=1 Tax=Arachis ipaensis TaxID=130454 RepID=UPI0007AF20A3|nr:isoleucine N-monooxygenase 2-like [Arachis ipaensis]
MESSLISSLRFWYLLLLLVGFITPFLKFLKHQITSKRKQTTLLPPGPKPWPIIGNLPEMLANKSAARWIHKIMSDLNTEIACIRLGNIHVIPITSPEIARELLTKQDSIFASRPMNWSSEHVSSGFLSTIFAPYGEQWKRMKRVMANELVSPRRLQWLQDKRVEEADNIVLYVYNQCNKNGGGLVDTRIVGRHYCGNIIRRLVFNSRHFGKGREDGGPGFEEVEHIDAIFTVLRYLFAFSISDYVACLRELDLDGHKKNLKMATKLILKYHDPLIEDRVQQWKNGKRTCEEDLLDVLISLKDANDNPLLTLDEIKSQIMDMMIATVDNPSNAFEWGLAEMLNRPKTLRKAVEELDTVVGKERQVQESDIPKLNYIKACAREVFRLHPIDDINTTHVSMEDTFVANNTYFIPKGSHIVLRRQGIGQNPRIWEEPLKFKPERHLEKDNNNIDGFKNLSLNEPSLKLITFSTGRRGCPGINLGSTMTVMLFARMLHGFNWSVPPNETTIDLSETEGGTIKAKPLMAFATPRLPAEVYGVST